MFIVAVRLLLVVLAGFVLGTSRHWYAEVSLSHFLENMLFMSVVIVGLGW